jgi:hypothetical protein
MGLGQSQAAANAHIPCRKEEAFCEFLSLVFNAS